MNYRLPRSRFLIATLTAALLAIPASAGPSDLEQHLRDQYVKKTLVLRGFYSGKHLRYDSAGMPTSPQTSGDWTADGFVRVNEVHFSHQRLMVKAGRLDLAPDYRKGFQLQSKESAHIEIAADLSADNPRLDQVDALMSRIFLTPHDNLADLVPDYWRQCVSDGEVGKGSNCRFSSEILAIPGLAPSTASATPPSASDAEACRVGKGVSPPKLIFHKDPEFSERARRARFQGVVTLGLVVNTEGLPTKIHIVRPLGYGLDAKAVEAVQQWRFKPSEKDGQPVAAQIAVEVDFHLY
jgi:TonB family protein